MASTVAAVGRAAPALLRWATVRAPGSGRPLGLDVDGGGHGDRIYRPPAPATGAGCRTPVGSARVTEASEPLLERDVDPDPLVQFGRWFDDAATVVASPEAMAVATADRDGRPSVRMVLLKGWGRGRVRVLHQLRQPQGPRARPSIPTPPSSSTGSRGVGRCGSRGRSERTERRGVRRLLRHPAPRGPDRGLRLAPEPGHRRPRRCSTPRWRPSQAQFAGSPDPATPVVGRGAGEAPGLRVLAEPR